MRRITYRAAILFLLTVSLDLWPGAPYVRAAPATPPVEAILRYISAGWNTLTRSMSECKTFVDSNAHTQQVLYLPADFPAPAGADELPKNCSLRVLKLPTTIARLGAIDLQKIHPEGLLYLPHPYVVPGGMFNEMYGWDSYFIIRGLLEEGKVDLARGMVENFFFEIDHYGGILNANRGYFLTRSQPPFLTSMILAVYDREKAQGHEDRGWLEEAYEYAVKDYQLWTQPPHTAGDTGLSRYYDFGSGPVPELGAQSDEYYGHAIRYFVSHPDEAGTYLTRPGHGGLVGSVLSDLLCPPGISSKSGKGCQMINNTGLSAEFYQGDRAMRESGFDVTSRFGPYGAGTTDYAPVCLNSLLYKAETDLERISRELGKGEEAAEWHRRSAARARRINQYLWNAQRGLFFDYDVKAGKQSNYEFAATFYPLWAGLAGVEQAGAVEKNLLLFERAGGIATSTRETGAQWDYPYGWAPLQLIAVEGLRRYHFDQDANRISQEFLTTVLENFGRDKTIHEKYNVVTRSSATHIGIGYTTNVVGFGWTNAVFITLFHELPKDIADRLK